VANSRSARKRIRSSEHKRIRNRTVRSAVRTTVIKARRALLGGTGGVDPELEVRTAIRALDRAAEKGILHPNNARRRKSRLAAMASRLARAAQGAEGERAAVRSAAAGGAKGRSSRATAARKPAKAAQPAATTRRPRRTT